MTEHHSPEITPQQVQGTTRKASSSGNVEYGEPVILSETSRSKVIARPWYIPHSDRTRLSLKIQTLRKADPPNSWIEVEEKSITLREDATEKLVAELPKFAAVAQQESTGDYLIVKLADGTAEISNLDPEAVVAGLLSALSQEGITEHLNGAELGPELAKALRHSVRLTEMKQAMLELRTLLENGQNQERFYQEWCESHPWAFGNQFVVNDTIRNISIQDQVDLLMPRIMALKKSLTFRNALLTTALLPGRLMTKNHSRDASEYSTSLVFSRCVWKILHHRIMVPAKKGKRR